MSEHRIAVITPYYKESVDVLAQCHQSVIGQHGVAVDHFMVADGHPLDAIDEWNVSHVKLPRAHGDNGNTPRGIGSLLASCEGYDFIAYLDADNWYHEGHLQSLLDLREQTGATICSGCRTFHDAAGNLLPGGLYEPEEFDLRHVDTSCLLIHRSGFELLPVWLDMPKALSPVCDRVFLAAIKHRNISIATTGQRTVAFRTLYRTHYEVVNLPVPEDAKDLSQLAPLLEYLESAEAVDECMRTLGFWPQSYVEL